MADIRSGTDLTAGICEQILTEMSNFTGINTPELMLNNNGFLDALTSPMNTSGVEVIPMGQENSDVRFARIRWIQRSCTDDVITDAADRTCQAGTEKTPLQEIVEIDKFIGSSNIKISRDVMNQLCVDKAAFGAWFRRILMAEMNAVRTVFDRELLEDAVLNCVGVNNNNLVSGVPSSSAKPINVLTGDCKNNCIDGINDMLIDYSEHQLNGMPMLVGQGNMKKAMLNLGWGCCNNMGVDFDKVSAFVSQRGFAWFADDSFNATVADNNLFLIAPGAMQLVFWNENKGQNNIAYNENYAHTVFADPLIPGLDWDLDVEYKECDKAWYLRFYVRYHLHCWPSTIFASCDDLIGVTGVFQYEALAIA